MIVLDASVLIAYLDRTDALHAAAQTVLEHAADDDFAASTITLAEVLVGPMRTGHQEAVLAALRGIAVAEVPLPAEAAWQLAELRARSGLKLPDCCVLLAAHERGARLASFDDRLIRAAESEGTVVVAR